MFVAFYKISDSFEKLLLKVGWLRDHVLQQRAIFESYLLTPWQTVAWVSDRAKIGAFRALGLMLRSFALSGWGEKKATIRLQKLFAKNENARALIETAPETLPYRGETEIRNLFDRLGIPLKQLRAFGSCYIAQT